MPHRSVGEVVDKELLPVVLVIEDDQDIQAVLDDALRDGGFEPAIAGSGEEAVTLLKAFGANYRAVVTDIKLMGSLDGWRVARAAREVDPAFPIVYITGAGRWNGRCKVSPTACCCRSRLRRRNSSPPFHS